MSTHVFHYFNHALVFDARYDTPPQTPSQLSIFITDFKPVIQELIAAAPLRPGTHPGQLLDRLTHYITSISPKYGLPRWQTYQHPRYKGPQPYAFPEFILNLCTYELQRFLEPTQDVPAPSEDQVIHLNLTYDDPAPFEPEVIHLKLNLDPPGLRRD